MKHRSASLTSCQWSPVVLVSKFCRVNVLMLRARFENVGRAYAAETCALWILITHQTNAQQIIPAAMAHSADSPAPDNDLTEIEATVVSGLESMAREEIREKLGARAEICRGRVWFSLPADRVKEIFKLQSVDNLFVVVHRYAKADFVGDTERDLDGIYSKAQRIKWDRGVKAWTDIRAAHRTLEECFALMGFAEDQVSVENVEKLPRFRVTCNRSGKQHKFTSMEAAAKFGAGVNDFFHWKVDMKNFDMNIILNIADLKMDILIALTTSSLHHRNLVEFGPTSLRSTIAYCMLRLCRIKPGELIVDPLCGGGSIPIEAARNFRNSFVLCADHHELAVPRCHSNINHNSLEGRSDILRWDSTNMPLRDAMVDVLVTDLPFGKRMGCKRDNRCLYRDLLQSMARAAVPGTARAVLLTQDRRSLTLAVSQCQKWWRAGYTVACNIGGLDAIIMVCHRSTEPY